MRILILVLSFLLISCAPHRIVVSTPINLPVSLNNQSSISYNDAWKIAIDRTLAVRPDADQDKVRIAPFVVRVVRVLPDYINPVSGKSGFFLDTIPKVPQSALNAAIFYPDSTINNRLLVEGYTDVFTPGTITVYVLESGGDQVIAHEFLHALWFLLYPAEYCPNTNLQIWGVIDHGLACDPMVKH